MVYDLTAAHRISMYNRSMLEEDSLCGCFHCRKIFSPMEITNWCDQGKTALCPHCGIDSVIAESAGYPLTAEFLEEMHARWFVEKN